MKEIHTEPSYLVAAFQKYVTSLCIFEPKTLTSHAKLSFLFLYHDVTCTVSHWYLMQTYRKDVVCHFYRRCSDVNSACIPYNTGT